MIPAVHALDCWQNTQRVAGEAWEEGRDVAEVVTWIFLRVLGAVAPIFIIGEVLFTLYQRVSFHMQRNKLEEQITELNEENEPFREQIRTLTEETQRVKVAADQIKWESKTVLEQRDLAFKERDEKTIGRANLERQLGEVQELTAKVQEELKITTAEMEKALEEKEAEEKENERLLEGLEDVKKRLAQESLDKELFVALDHAINTVQEDLPETDNGAQEELEKLLPLYEEQKQAYRKMFQDEMEKLPEEDPKRIPMKGLIDISLAESRHQTRVSEIVLFHKDLRQPYLELIQEELERAK